MTIKCSTAARIPFHSLIPELLMRLKMTSRVREEFLQSSVNPSPREEERNEMNYQCSEKCRRSERQVFRRKRALCEGAPFRTRSLTRRARRARGRSGIRRSRRFSRPARWSCSRSRADTGRTRPYHFGRPERGTRTGTRDRLHWQTHKTCKGRCSRNSAYRRTFSPA